MKYLISKLLIIRVRLLCAKKIFRININIRPDRLPNKFLFAYSSRWKPVSRFVLKDWLRIYVHISGKRSLNYVPEDLYYSLIEPVLNFKPMSNAETCKSKYKSLYPGYNFPHTLLVNENGVLYDDIYTRITMNSASPFSCIQFNNVDSVVVKPSLDSGGGAGVRKFNCNDNGYYEHEGVLMSQDSLNKMYGRDYIVQDCIQQHDFFASFNRSSVNTLRVLTYRSVRNEAVHILHTILRVGKIGSITDNQASGGYSIGVTPEGILNEYAVDKHGERTSIVNGNLLNGDLRIPQISRFHDIAISLASKFTYSRLLGIDLIMDKKGEIIVIEINNSSNEINFYQMNNGPLFGSFTKEVIDYCIREKKSYCIDFVV